MAGGEFLNNEGSRHTDELVYAYISKANDANSDVSLTS